MSDDVFARLERELAYRTREGAHLSGSVRARHRRGQRRRRSMVAGLSAVVLAVSLVSAFPATASGHVRRAAAAHLASV